MSEKLPWFKFFVFDWVSDSNVQTMSLIERGFYIEILCRIWIEDGIKNDRTHVEHLFNTCSANDEECSSGVRTKVIDSIIARLQETDDGKKLTHWKLEELRQENEKLILKRRKAGEKSAESRRKKSKEHMLNTCSTRAQHMSNKPEPEPEPDNSSTSTGFAEAPSLEEAIRSGETNSIPKALVEKWWTNNQLRQWPVLDSGIHWSKALWAYWTSIPPKAQQDWRQPANGKKKLTSPDKTNRPDKPQL